MVGFHSDNPTGSAWVTSRQRMSLPQRTGSLESPFLAGDYAKADRRRQKRLQRSERRHHANSPRTWTRPRTETSSTPVSPSRTPQSYEVQRPTTVAGSTTTIGRLSGVTVPHDQSFLATASRKLQNFANDRLKPHDATFSGASGFALDGIELTKQEYSAWMGGDPEANKHVHVDGGNRSPTRDTSMQ